MAVIKHISFNGVDILTDLDRLISIQKRFPLAEFGIILSKNWDENGNRYFDPHILERFKGLPLNLSAHLCGSVAREAIKDNWQPTIDLCCGNFNIFKERSLTLQKMLQILRNSIL